MIPYRSEQPHDCGGTIRAGDPVLASPKAPPYYYCDRCNAFRFDDAPGFFPTGTDAEANRDAWDRADARSPDAPEDRIGAPLAVGDIVQVLGQDIRGVVLRLHGTTAIVYDVTLPVCDAELEFRFRDLRRVATAAECGAAPDDAPEVPAFVAAARGSVARASRFSSSVNAIVGSSRQRRCCGGGRPVDVPQPRQQGLERTRVVRPELAKPQQAGQGHVHAVRWRAVDDAKSLDMLARGLERDGLRRRVHRRR